MQSTSNAMERPSLILVEAYLHDPLSGGSILHTGIMFLYIYKKCDLEVLLF